MAMVQCTSTPQRGIACMDLPKTRRCTGTEDLMTRGYPPGLRHNHLLRSLTGEKNLWYNPDNAPVFKVENGVLACSGW